MIIPLSPKMSLKETLRLKMAGERKAAARARPDAGVHAAARFMDAIAPQPGATVGLYHPINDELDTKPLAEALLKNACAIALPVIAGKSAPLVFRAFARGDALTPGKFGVMTPLETAPEAVPDIIVTPLLAFDRFGNRLGYGGGYYDRTLAMRREEGPLIAVGYGYGVQEIDALPTTPLDAPLDWIITERGARRPDRPLE